MVGKPYVSAFQNFFRIENLLNIKEIMSKNMFVYLRHLRHKQHYIHNVIWTSPMSLTYIAFDQLFIFKTIFNTFDMKVIT